MFKRADCDAGHSFLLASMISLTRIENPRLAQWSQLLLGAQFNCIL